MKSMTCASNLCRPRLLLAVVISVAFVAWVSFHWGYSTAERSYQAELDQVVLRELVKDVEAIRSRLGRAPEHQAEVESLIGRRLPYVHDDGVLGGTYPTQVHYRRTADDSFQLQFELWATDDWIYDSTNPSAGWVQHWY